MSINASNYFLSCDWGTTSFRLKLVDLASGNVAGSLEDAQGIKLTFDLWTRAQPTEDREAFYLHFLQEKINELSTELDIELDEIPLIASGMVSSSIGLRELPYASVPCSLDDPQLVTERLERAEHFPHSLTIVSGLHTDQDVMRGEETQILGIYATGNHTNGIYILPGTHSKHVFIENGAVVDFSTFMTGELFDLLSSQSVLRNSLQPSPSVSFGAIRQGIQQARHGNLLNSLFRIRAGDLLHGSNQQENFYFLSGLLIGAELASLKHDTPEKILLAGEGRLQELYSEGLNYMELDHEVLQETGRLAPEGHRHILNAI